MFEDFRRSAAANLKSNTGSTSNWIIWNPSVMLFGFVLVILIVATKSNEDDSSDLDYNTLLATLGEQNSSSNWTNATLHTRLGHHFVSTEFSAFQSHAVYTTEHNYSMLAMGPVYKLVHLFFDQLEPILPGYVVVKVGDTLSLGPMVVSNDWSSLLAQYWAVYLWIIFLLLLILIVPFIAVCYCCIWCRRCKRGCPPCDQQKDARKFYCWGSILVLLMLGILLGLIIAYANHSLLDIGLQQSNHLKRRGTEDTCTILKDAHRHIQHLFIKNYEEMSDHLEKILNEAGQHVSSDLLDISETVAAVEFDRIVMNMEKALSLMRILRTLHTDLRFYGRQLVDGLRGIKRGLTYVCIFMCGNSDCIHFLQRSRIQFIDTSPCLHFDKLPNVGNYMRGIESIIKARDLTNIKLDKIVELVKAGVNPIVPPLLKDIKGGQEFFRSESTALRIILDEVISEIHSKTVQSNNSFEDLIVKFGSARKMIHYTIFGVILMILILLTIAILFGCCDRDHSDKICNKSTGATCLLIAIVLIFSVFSLVVLVGLFYFVMGLITYQGACAPFEDPQIKSMLNRKDSFIELNRDTTKDVNQSKPVSLRMSTEIGECLPNETIFSILLGSNLYDLENKLRVKVIHSPTPEPIFFPNNFVDFNINLRMPKLLNNNFRDYHSEKFTKFLCDELTPVDLTGIIKEIFLLHPKLWSQWGIYDWARIALQNEAVSIQKLYEELVPTVLSHINEMRQILLEIDKLVLYKSNQFDESLKILQEMSTRATTFMKAKGEKTASELRRNVTIYVDDQINNYIEMVISKCLNNVGKCAPLAYIYYRSIDMACNRLINPMNGLWVGLLLCCLLFLPIVFLAHHLQCLYRKMYQYRQYESQRIGIIEGGCARCTAYATHFQPGFVADQPHYSVNRTEMASIVTESVTGPVVAGTEAVLASNTLKRKQE